MIRCIDSSKGWNYGYSKDVPHFSQLAFSAVLRLQYRARIFKDVLNKGRETRAEYCIQTSDVVGIFSRTGAASNQKLQDGDERMTRMTQPKEMISSPLPFAVIIIGISIPSVNVPSSCLVTIHNFKFKFEIVL
jgi:hypothetical protein